MTDTPTLPIPLEWQDTEWFADKLSEIHANLRDFVDENKVYFAQIPEPAFLEAAAQFVNLTNTSKRAVGDMCWARMVSLLGRDAARESEERHATLGRWAAKIGVEYHALDRWLNDAMARELVPDVADLSPTAGSEIVRNAGDSDDEIRETVKERLDNVRELDPELTNSTQATRDVKQAEKNGNHKPSLIRRKDLSDEQFHTDWIVYGNVKVGENKNTETGEIEDVYEYLPVMRLYIEDVQAEILRPQVEHYQDMLLRRITSKERENDGKPNAADGNQDPAPAA